MAPKHSGDTFVADRVSKIKNLIQISTVVTYGSCAGIASLTIQLVKSLHEVPVCAGQKHVLSRQGNSTHRHCDHRCQELSEHEPLVSQTPERKLAVSQQDAAKTEAAMPATDYVALAGSQRYLAGSFSPDALGLS